MAQTNNPKAPPVNSELVQKYSGAYVEDKVSEYTGFYYDNQMSNQNLILSLHPSTYQDNKGEWICYSKEESLRPCMETEKVYYSKVPIAKCLLTDDISFGINNNFSDFNGGNPIEAAWGAAKSWSPILSSLGQNLDKAGIGTKTGGVLSDFARDVGKKIEEGSKMMGDNLNNALIIQGSRFSYYNGSNFGFNNLEMKFIKFSDYCKKEKAPSSKKSSWVGSSLLSDDVYEFVDVRDYIRYVLGPYSFGTYHPVDLEGKDGGYINKIFGDDIGSTIKETVKNYVGMQTPPGGFKMETQNLDHALIGTLRLNIGGMYAIENLVIKNIAVNLSKVQAKHPEKEGCTVPLYAEISITLAPAGMITDSTFSKIMGGAGMTAAQTAQTTNYKESMKELLSKRRKSLGL